MATALQIITKLLFNETGWLGILLTAVYIVGLWRIFQKSDVPSWWALIPFSREYWLGKCAGKVFEGQVAALSGIIEFLLFLSSYFFGNEYVLISIALLSVITSFIKMIYRFQIYTGLVDVYGVRKRWAWYWFFFTPIVSILWGYSRIFKPQWKVSDFRNTAVSHVKGKDIVDIGEGLTVNLTDRTVIERLEKKQLLKDIHMHIRPGRMVMLLGGSGAGKTTFVNAINGYEKANAEIILNGQNVYSDYKKMQYECGFVPQNDLIRSKDTVYHTLNDYAKLRLPNNFSGQDRKERIEEALTIFGLTPVQNQLVEKLSGGQRKRLSIAMEFLSNPQLFILDEPDSGLDGVMARELYKQLRIVADTGRIVIAITHTPDRVIEYFDDVIILAKDSERTGRLAFYGTVEECRTFFEKEKMEEIVKIINRTEEGGDGRADEFIIKYAQEAQYA